jgi:hypothetical protein
MQLLTPFGLFSILHIFSPVLFVQLEKSSIDYAYLIFQVNCVSGWLGFGRRILRRILGKDSAPVPTDLSTLQ